MSGDEAPDSILFLKGYLFLTSRFDPLVCFTADAAVIRSKLYNDTSGATSEKIQIRKRCVSE